jgi:hypothetical protein
VRKAFGRLRCPVRVPLVCGPEEPVLGRIQHRQCSRGGWRVGVLRSGV